MSQNKAKPKSFGAKEIMKALDIDDEEGPQDPSEKKPIKMMDIVMDIWGIHPNEEEDDD